MIDIQVGQIRTHKDSGRKFVCVRLSTISNHVFAWWIHIEDWPESCHDRFTWIAFRHTVWSDKEIDSSFISIET